MSVSKAPLPPIRASDFHRPLLGKRLNSAINSAARPIWRADFLRICEAAPPLKSRNKHDAASRLAITGISGPTLMRLMPCRRPLDAGPWILAQLNRNADALPGLLSS